VSTSAGCALLDSCAPGGRLTLNPELSGGQLSLELTEADTRPVATRCPGPDDESAADGLATGSIAYGGLRRRVTRIPLTTGASFTDDGYIVRTAPHLTLTLTRVGVRIVNGPTS